MCEKYKVYNIILLPIILLFIILSSVFITSNLYASTLSVTDINIESYDRADKAVALQNIKMTYAVSTESANILKDITKKVLPSNVNFLSGFAPDNYRDIYSPTGNSPFEKYSTTYYGDDSNTSMNIGLMASNFLLDNFFYSITSNIFSFNFASTQANNIMEGIKFLIQPIYWLKLKFTIDLTRNAFSSSNLELEINPTLNTAFILKTKDNVTESKTGIEFLLRF